MTTLFKPSAYSAPSHIEANSFDFYIHFRQKVPASQIGAPQREILDPPLMLYTINYECTIYIKQRQTSKPIPTAFTTIQCE